MDIRYLLNEGYVRLVDKMGSDLTVANSARVSYNKEVSVLSEKDEKLIRFLANNDHTSPFRHAVMQFEVYAPLMVARQWWKYVIGGAHQQDAWNESSRRYITEEPIFYVPSPDEWRKAPENSKQGSGENFKEEVGFNYTIQLEKYIQEGESLYNSAIEGGVAPEQARLFLPAYGMYVRWYWTGSLQQIAHLVNQRVAHDAQKEFQEYARIINTFATEVFPVSMKHLVKLEGEK